MGCGGSTAVGTETSTGVKTNESLYNNNKNSQCSLYDAEKERRMMLKKEAVMFHQAEIRQGYHYQQDQQQQKQEQQLQQQQQQREQQQEQEQKQQQQQQQQREQQQEQEQEQQQQQEQQLQQQQEQQQLQQQQQQQQQQQPQQQQYGTIQPFEDKFDPSLPTYTIFQLLEHNASQQCVDLFRFHQMVCSSKTFKTVIEPHVRDFETENDVDEDDRFDFAMDFALPPIFMIWSSVGLRMKVIQSVLGQCKVGQWKELSENETQNNIKCDVIEIYNGIGEESDASGYLEEYRQLLDRFRSKLSLGKTNFKNDEIPRGDPNTIEFPLPVGVRENPEVLRSWIESWEGFDFEVPEGGSWSMYDAKLVFNESNEAYEDEIKSQDELPELDFEIEGEAAWEVFDLDIVKNDITTENQDKIWESRDKITDLDDPERMKRRRGNLEIYFIQKYEWDPSKLDPYKGFADLLQKQWEEFQTLCNES